MEPFKQHEVFELETLQFMRNRRLLDSLVFGGGTMLRLCHGLNRYFVDLDFYLKEVVAPGGYFKKLSEEFSGRYVISDFNVKLGSLLPPEDRAYYRENRFAYLDNCLVKI